MRVFFYNVFAKSIILFVDIKAFFLVSSSIKISFFSWTKVSIKLSRLFIAIHGQWAQVAWKERLSKGKEKLYANAINGIGAMPAKGGRSDLPDNLIEMSVDYIIQSTE